MAKSADDIARNLAFLVQKDGPQDIKGVTQAGKVVVASGQPILVNGVTIRSVMASTPEGSIPLGARFVVGLPG